MSRDNLSQPVFLPAVLESNGAFVRDPDAMPVTPAPAATDTANLRRLFQLRTIAVAAQALTVAAVVWGLDMAIPWRPALAVVGGLALFNVWTWTLLRRGRPVSDTLLLGQLLADVAGLTALFYFTGGATNPFTAFYLLPLAIAATLLPPRHTWLLTAITVGCYTVLVRYHVPLPHVQGHDSFSLHVTAMWVGFIISAVLLASFVVGMATALRRRERELAAAREQALRDDQLVALGAQAATAAHELGTPLATIGLLLEELEDGAGADPAALEVMRQQVRRCKEALSRLSRDAGNVPASTGAPVAAGDFVHRWLDAWRQAHPGCELTVHQRCDSADGAVVADRTLTRALDNLLDNAQRASPGEVEVDVHTGDGALVVEVADRGPGLPDETARRARRGPCTGPAQGLGLGLFLSHAVIERMGGEVSLFPREGGGTRIRVRLPLMEAARG